MNHTMGFLSEEIGFILDFNGGSVLLSALFFCAVLCFFCFVVLRPVSCVSKDASASGLSILDFHFGFL